ncbi:MAG TPA: hypothetical protein VM659_21410 [Dongiaceae bacterium]|nr:hypothetical protein [Dongiaceae bacterium]
MTDYRCSKPSSSPRFAAATGTVDTGAVRPGSLPRRDRVTGLSGRASAIALMIGLAAGIIGGDRAWALSSDPASGAPVQLGVPGAATGTTGSPSTGNSGQGGISATPLPPISQPTVQQPTIQQPTVQAPSVAQPQAPVVAPVAQPTIATNAAAANATASSTATPGLLDDQHQGLGLRLWQGSDAVVLKGLLPQLSAPVTQPSLRDLQLRLLLTQAPGPMTPEGLDSLVPLRAERLRAMGFEAEANLLTQQSNPGDSSDPQNAAEKLLQAGDNDAACAKVRDQVSGMPKPQAFWQRATIFCQILNGQNDQASIGIDLLREQGAGDPHNKDFVAVANILTGDSKPQSLKAPISNPEPLLAAMMKRANLKLPPATPGAVPSLPVGPVAQAAVARDATKPLAERIKAAEFAFATGLLPADELTGLYLQVPPAAGQAAISGMDTPEHRGQLYQLAQRGQMPANRAQVISQALREAMLRGDYFTALPLYLPFVQQITPNAGLAWFAPDAARALLAGGNIEKGGFWLNLAQGASADPDVAKAVPGLSLLARIAGVYGTRDAGRDPVADWKAASGADDAGAQRLYGILAGLGDPIANHSGASLPGNGDPQIGAAAQAGRRGETVLRALILLAGRGLAQADGAGLAQALGGLNGVGLAKEARHIATEAAIWSGV